MVFNSNTLIAVIKRDADGTTWHAFEDKGCKIMLKFNLDESRCEPALPAEPESQPEFPPKRHTETQTELEPQCEGQSKPQSVPSSEAQHEIEVTLQSNSQLETHPDPPHEGVKNAAEEAGKIKSIRDRLGDSVTYLEELLKIGDVVKDVSRLFQIRPPTVHEFSRRSTRSSAFP